MMVEFKTQRRVEFCETDMAGIAHFSNFFRYMEEAEHEFLRSAGLNVVMYDDKGSYGFPKIDAACHFKNPAPYDVVIDIALKVDWEDGKSINYQCEMRHEEVLIATGSIQVACCRFPRDGSPFAIPIPDHVLDSLNALRIHE